MTINKVILLGNVGAEPEIRQTTDGRDIANFSLATSESWKDKDSKERKEKTEWHRIVVFGAAASFVKNYIRKGSRLYIEGQIQTRKWTDNKGVDKYITEVIVQSYNGTIKNLTPKDPNGKDPVTEDDLRANFNVKDEREEFDSIPF